MHHELSVYGRSSKYFQHLVPNLSSNRKSSKIHGRIYICLYDHLLDRNGNQPNHQCIGFGKNFSQKLYTFWKPGRRGNFDNGHAVSNSHYMGWNSIYTWFVYRCDLSADICNFLRMVSACFRKGIQCGRYFYLGRRYGMRMAGRKNCKCNLFLSCHVYSVDFFSSCFSDRMALFSKRNCRKIITS